MSKLMKFLSIFVITLFSVIIDAPAQNNQKSKPVNDSAVPIIVDGQAQIVPRFTDPDMWIRLGTDITE